MLNDEEIRAAYFYWRRDYRHFQTDEEVVPHLQLPKLTGWLVAVRKALGFSATQVATRAGISRSAYSRMEKFEDLGNLTLKSLRKAAAAMDCEVVYAIRPKSKQRFSQIVWERTYQEHLEHVWLSRCDPKRKAQALAHVVPKCP